MRDQYLTKGKRLDKVFLDFDRSYSQIDNYRRCPRRFYNTYGLKQWGEGTTALKFGSLVHEKIADLLINRKFNISDKELQEAGLTKPDGVKTLVSRAMLGLEELRIDTKRIAKEDIEFTLKYGKFKAKIDLLGFANDEPVIVDWKTTSWEYDEHKILSSWQLISYAWVYWKNRKEIPTTAYITLDKRSYTIKVYSIRYDVEDFLEFEHILGAVESGIKYGYFPKNESGCHMYGGTCMFYDKCWPKKNKNLKLPKPTNVSLPNIKKGRK